MTQLINYRFETDLSEWEGTVTDSGDLYWAAAAGFGESAGGMAALIDDTAAIYGYEILASPDTSGKVRARFWFDPNTVSMPVGEDFVLLGFRNNAPAFVGLVRLMYSNSLYRIYATIYNDAAGSSNTTAIVITDAPHCIEVYLQRATGGSTNDGRIDVWVDGASQQTV